MAIRPLRIAGAFVAALSLLVSGAARGQERIAWWHSLPPGAIAAYQPLIDQFQQETGIRVELRFVAPSRLYDELSVAQVLGSPPDVVSVASHAGEPLAERGAFVDLTARIQADPDFVDFFPAGLLLWRTAAGSHYAVPVELEVPALYYNAEAFASRGVSAPSDIGWDEWYELAVALSEDQDLDGRLDTYGLSGWWFHPASLVWANGGEIFSFSGAIALGSPAAREALSFYKRFYEEGLLPQISDAKRLGFAHPGELFKAGRVAMAPAGPWMPQVWVYDPWTGVDAFEIGVAPLPRSFVGQRTAPLTGNALAIPTGTPKIAAAWAFIKRLTSPEALAAQPLTGVPARITVAGERLTQPGPAVSHWRVFTGALAYARPFPQGVDWWEGTGAAVTSALERYLRGELSFEAALEWLSARLGREVASFAAPAADAHFEAWPMPGDQP